MGLRVGAWLGELMLVVGCGRPVKCFTTLGFYAGINDYYLCIISRCCTEGKDSKVPGIARDFTNNLDGTIY